MRREKIDAPGIFCGDEGRKDLSEKSVQVV